MAKTHAPIAAGERRQALRRTKSGLHFELAGRLVAPRDWSMRGYAVPLAAMPGEEGDLVIGNLVDALGRRATFASEVTRIDRGRGIAAAAFVGHPVQIEALLARQLEEVE